MRAAFDGELPPRYAEDPFGRRFQATVRRALRPGQSILDIGSGRRPVLGVDERPQDCRYVGLDISQQELATAPQGSYDEVVVADARDSRAELRGRFDLVLSFQVLEHVKPIDAALASARECLRPGGTFIAQLSGGRSAAGRLNRLLPAELSVWLVSHMLGRDRGRIFPAHYDRCYYTALQALLTDRWSEWEIASLHTGADYYFGFSRLARAAYIGYEEWLYLEGRRDDAMYYVIRAIA